MRKEWKDTTEVKKRRFPELYNKAGDTTRTIAIQLVVKEPDIRAWRDTTQVLGTSIFLMSHTSEIQYSYEVELAAVKSHI